MPIYEYACEKCGPHEVIQKITDPALKACTKCGSKSVQRLISGSSFTLKGGGWYSDLYGSTGSPKGRGGSKGSGSSSAA